MAAHQLLAKYEFRVSSYGTNSHISLPGPGGKSNTYDFGTTYTEIVASLQEQNHPYYTERGLIEMIQRDQQIKDKPERFTTTFDHKKQFDVIFTYGQQVLEKILGEFHTSGNVTFQLCHIINIETQDDNQNALISAGTSLRLARAMAELPNITEGLEALLNQVVEGTADPPPITYHIVSY
jgi:RNA polymerase II subunit A C-terminal domain phosphatase SSU72